MPVEGMTSLAKRQAKLLELEELADRLAVLRSEGKKVVLCHGVFDLLHIGHIRYLERAKQLGDVLVVTVTPDRFVNKGPHRPAFAESLRLEAIAALECVDHVMLNRWPMAVETIRLLKPNLYVKGPDYKEAERDRTGGIILEEEAVKSVGGQLVITDDAVFSSSALLNRHFSAFPKEVHDYLAAFAVRHPFDEIVNALSRVRTLNVLVVGEAIIDQYHYCEAIGKSSKEPMLAVKSLSAETFAGGILAVGNHVANICEQSSLITLLGTENSHEEFIRQRLHPSIRPRFIHRQGSPTIVKRRFIESYFFTKLLETYEMNDEALSPEDDATLCEVLKEELPRYDVALIVDFGHDMLTKSAVEIICDRANFLAVNAQCNAGNMGYHSISRYRRADYVCLAEKEIRMEARDRRGELREVVHEVSKKFNCPITVTRGNRGCLSYSQQEGFSEVPALATHVVDRMGAGDAFLSVAGLCVAAGVPLEVVGLIGNVVGAGAVATVGHRASVDRSALLKHIESLLK